LIAVISSTIFPGDAPTNGGASRSVYTADERLHQTCLTVSSLRAIGLTEIHLADNSGNNWVEGTERRLGPATVHRFAHYQFHNKGIAELYLLLEMLDRLPADSPILKISGRYALRRNITDQLGNADVAAKWYGGNRTISTRCYMVQNTRVYRSFLEDTLNEVYGDAARFRGPRSLMRIVRNSIFASADANPYFDPPVSIECAAARALLRKKYTINRMTDLALEGEIAITGDEIRE
jgi:hypothetical protein